MPQHRNKHFSQVVRVTLYKSVIAEAENVKKKDFVLWGPSDYLYVDVFSSLADLALIEDSEINNDNLSVLPLTEDRHLYLYKDKEANLFPKKALSWIFSFQRDYPLITITLLKAGNPKDVSALLAGQSYSGNYIFDVFKTIGKGSSVLVFRSNTYEPVLHSIVELNQLCENTYSIPGVQNDPSLTIFDSSKSEPSTSRVAEELASVTVEFMLKDNDGSRSRITGVIHSLNRLYQNARVDFDIPADKLRLWSYLVIGRYDIEVRIEGHTTFILMLLLNPKYGLVNFESKFYKKNVFESRTTWKTPWLQEENIQK
jgi:hypothetical protein